MKWDAEKYDAVKAPQIDAGRELIELARVREDDHVLDIGCGTGKLTVELARLASKGAVVGIDPSEEMLEKAGQVSVDSGNLDLVRTEAAQMDISDRFDLAFSNSAMQWVKDQKRAIGLTCRALKRGGRLAFQMPAKDFCREFFSSVEYAVASLGYERFYERWESPWYFPAKEEYEDLLRGAGFQAIDVFSREYRLTFAGIPEVVRWWASAGLRPYLAVLPEGAHGYFQDAFAEGFEKGRTGRGIEFTFRRLFAFAGKG
jgi:trans-aconitate methyltransferase